MAKRLLTPYCFAAIALAGVSLPAAADSLRNTSAATSDSVDASTRLAASSGQIVLGAVAVPLKISGAVTETIGKGATEAGHALSEAANAPLEVSDETLVAQPPPRFDRPTD